MKQREDHIQKAVELCVTTMNRMMAVHTFDEAVKRTAREAMAYYAMACAPTEQMLDVFNDKLEMEKLVPVSRQSVRLDFCDAPRPRTPPPTQQHRAAPPVHTPADVRRLPPKRGASSKQGSLWRSCTTSAQAPLYAKPCGYPHEPLCDEREQHSAPEPADLPAYADDEETDWQREPLKKKLSNTPWQREPLKKKLSNTPWLWACCISVSPCAVLDKILFFSVPTPFILVYR